MRMSRTAATRSSVPAAMIEPLETRTLFAVSLPAGFQIEKVATVPSNATAMTFTPDGRLFVARQNGQVSVITKAGATLATPLVTVPLSSKPSSGAYGIAVDPNFATNGYFYVLYTHDTRPGQSAVAENRVSRFKIDPANPNKALAGSEKVIVGEMYSQVGGHNGGALAFGADGKLYVGSGEGSGELAGDSAAYAQDLNLLAGKILRVNPDGSIPADNPFVGQAGKRGEIWAYGFRNAFSAAIKPGTNTLFVNDVQSDKFEEVNNVQKGKNYGWPRAEGNSSNPAYANPIFTYAHADATDGKSAAITGGTFNTKSQFPAQYAGKYFFADYINKYIRVLDPATGASSVFAGSTPGTSTPGFIDLDQAADGSIYALAPFSTQVMRISYVGGANRAPTAVASADATSGPAPLTVNFSGAGSDDQDGDPLSYAWDFGDGTTGTGRTVSHTYDDAGTYNAVLTVSDGKGGSDVADPIQVRPGANAPVASITSPGAGLKYVAGQTFDFAGTATDAEDGDLPASAFEWKVVFHHATHTHPFIESIPGVKSGTFEVSRTNEVAPDQWYRVHLTVTDSSGVSTEVTRDILPVLSTITLKANVAGLKLNLDDQPQTLPLTFQGVVGQTRKLTAPASQVVGGVTYDFTGWADGATAATRSISTPAADTTFQANYKARTAPTSPGVTGLSLINADTDAKIGALTSGYAINLNATPRFNVRADVSGTVGSVVFKLDGKVVRTDSAAPFAAGNHGTTTYEPWTVAVGSHTLVATAYSKAGGTGTVLKSVTVSFSVTKPATATPTVTAFTLINATTDKVVKTLTNGTTIARSSLPKFTVGVNVSNAPGSIVFKLNGKVVKTESYAPFALSNNGITNGVAFYDPWTIGAGSYTLVATPFTQKDGLGTAGKSLTVSFKVT